MITDEMKTRKNCGGSAEKKYFEIASQDVSIKALRELGKKFSSHCYYNKSNECLIFEVFQMRYQGFIKEVCSITGVKEQDIPKAGYISFGSGELAFHKAFGEFI
tara:strand:- start:316 stop:627 length:312 start_codon:yes stop_codon:yes gene_type:complete